VRHAAKRGMPASAPYPMRATSWPSPRKRWTEPKGLSASSEMMRKATYRSAGSRKQPFRASSSRQAPSRYSSAQLCGIRRRAARRATSTTAQVRQRGVMPDECLAFSRQHRFSFPTRQSALPSLCLPDIALRGTEALFLGERHMLQGGMIEQRPHVAAPHIGAHAHRENGRSNAIDGSGAIREPPPTFHSRGGRRSPSRTPTPLARRALRGPARRGLYRPPAGYRSPFQRHRRKLRLSQRRSLRVTREA